MVISYGLEVMDIRKFIKFVFFMALFGGVAYYAYQFTQREVPNTEYVGIAHYNQDKPIFYQGELFTVSASGKKEQLMLPLEFLRTHIDPNIIYEKSSESVIVTTDQKVVRLRTQGLTSTINEKPFKLSFPIEVREDNVYIPIAPILDLYDLDIREDNQTGIVSVAQAGEPLQWGKIQMKDKEETIPLRTGPSIQEPILGDLSREDDVVIWDEDNGWYQVQALNGLTGYVQKSQVRLEQIETVPKKKDPVKPHVPWKPTGGKINMTWEHVTNKNPDTSKIDPMPGLNVISPTWFHLKDGEGNLANNADRSYVQWAHQQNLQVWALVDNGFDPDRTHEALSTYDRRMNMIKQLLSFAQMYNLQGINIDFEDVYLKDKQNVVQFVREFTPLAHEQGLVVSIDVTAKSSSERWSMFLDRKALAETVDYMMLMGYDEHWGSSPVAGSVASLPWVENSLVRILEEDDVPPSKLVLGVPTYTREWTEEQVDGKTKVSSRAIFMSRQERTIREQNLTPVFLEDVGQNYVEYKDGNATKKIWMEDAVSMKLRVELVKKYDLAGIASWRRGYESPDIWTVIEETLNQRP